MPSTHIHSAAEQRFRDAYNRLKSNSTIKLPKGSPVTQNNVAREAGCDPSSLKKSRFPKLIHEIQTHLRTNQNPSYSATTDDSDRGSQIIELLSKIKRLTIERDQALSKQVISDLLILDLSREVEMLKSKIDTGVVLNFKK